MTLKLIASGDLGWNIAALGRLDELGGAESVEWHSPDFRERPLFERSRPGLRFVDAARRPDCGVPEKSFPFMGTPPAAKLGRILVPAPERVAHYRAALPAGPLAALLPGWSDSVGGRTRRIPVEELAPLASIGYTFVCPLLRTTPEELEQLRALGLNVARPDGYDPAQSLDDEAALFELCDFVVSAVANEACIGAALGKPTYILSWKDAGQAGHARWFESVTVLEAQPEPPAPPSKWTPLVADLCGRLNAAAGASS